MGGVGIRFVQMLAVVADDEELIEHPRADARDEGLPDTDRIALVDNICLGIPAVEVADDRDPLGVRRPDGKLRAFHTVYTSRVGSQLLVNFVVRGVSKQMLI